MRISKEDKNNLIIIAVLVGIIAYVAVCYTGTRYLPLKRVGLICFLAMFILMGMITKRYLEVYRIKVGWIGYVPFLNAINTFPPVPALLLCVNLVVTAIALILTFLPADLLIHVMNAHAAMNIGSITLSVAYVSVYCLFFVLGAGYCAIYRDVRSMLYKATGLQCPKTECVNYALLFLSIINILGLSAILTALTRLQRFNYHEGDEEEEIVLNEVESNE